MISELKAIERSRAIENATMSDCMRIMKRMQEHVKDPAIKRFYSTLVEKGKLFVEFGDSLAEINHSMMEEASRATKIDPFKPIDEQEKDASQFMSIVQGKHFIRLCFDAVRMFTRAYAELASLTLDLEPGEIVASSSDKEGVAQTTEDLKNRLFEYQFNERTIKKYIGAVVGLDAAHDNFLQDVDEFTKTLENYYKYLEQRHRSGIKVHRDAIITDTAHAIFDNVDSHGEITATNSEMSAYTLSKGMLVVEAVNHPLISELIKGPDMLLEWIKGGINAFGQTVDELQKSFRDDVEFVLETICLVPSSSKGHDYALIYNKIRSANPGSIRSKEDEVFLSQNEKFAAESKEETIAEIVKMIEQKAGGGAMLKYIAERKAELKRYFQEENTFYVCQISQGNMFTGEAPGGIKVVPGKRPNIKMEHIVGSGFSEVIDFYESVEAGAKWQKLFIATSPSKSADKSNCLMVGPPGCHRKGQRIMLFNGKTIPVEKIRKGDLLMGPGGTKREVLSLIRGTGNMVEIRPKKGKSWVVNEDHILSLARSKKEAKYEIIDVSVKEWMTWSANKKSQYKLFRSNVVFKKTQGLPLDPYLLGLFLGDGSLNARSPLITTSDKEIVNYLREIAPSFGLPAYAFVGKKNNENKMMSIFKSMGLRGMVSGTKSIPHQYKISSTSSRLKLLAGYIDADGHNNSNTYDCVSKSKDLIDDITYIARSLGFSAYPKLCKKKSQNGVEGKYYRVIISGDVSRIPVKIKRKVASKREQIKNVLHTSFEAIPLPKKEKYYGFTVDKDNRYLLDDFTVTHNCGKTELMRAIGADKNCIGIFAQGSDFLTCWKGEADKNPKRLFEAALKLHKETNKRVYILIDEIDSVMHHANGPNDINLTLEFQILMDGIVSYPGVSVWGATNNPERIPMAMIRRFNKVSIVGELNKENRVKLLKHFLDSLPQKDFKQDDWERAAVKLDGATGDVIRQICDHIWRTKIHSFVKKDKDGAVKAIDFLEEREGGFDIDNFSESDRQKFKNVLQKYVNVVPSDVMSSINTHLKSMAIKSEIETAVNTYKAAKQFLNSVNSDGSLN